MIAPAISDERVTPDGFTSNPNRSGDLAVALPVGVFLGDLPVVPRWLCVTLAVDRERRDPVHTW